MCGRFLVDGSALDAAEEIAPIPKSFQIELELKTVYPTTSTCIFANETGHIRAEMASFGIENPYKKGLIINARAETVENRPMFKKAFLSKRCIIPCSLFYEWTPAKRQASFFEKDAAVTYLAGILFETDKGLSFVILTTEANASVSPVHHRMPVVLSKNEALGYLENTETASAEIHGAMPQLAMSWSQPALF